MSNWTKQFSNDKIYESLKFRAADSQRRMQEMMVRYEEMKQKLEWTRLTLEHTASQINQNDIKRAQQIQATVSRLKEKAEHCSGILKRKRERREEDQEDTDAFGEGKSCHFFRSIDNHNQ